MKAKYLLVFLVIFFYSGSQFSQDCLDQGIVFSSQSQIDSFPQNFPGCNRILGNVVIRGDFRNKIKRLDSLYQLTSIGGFLEISRNDSLSNLEGLENLHSLDGSLIIEENRRMASLKGLDNLTDIGSNLMLLGNSALLNAQGLEKLGYVGTNVQIQGNMVMRNLIGLSSLDSIQGSLIIEFNQTLTTLDGLDSLRVVRRDIQINANNSLKNFRGFGNLATHKGMFEVQNNGLLQSFEGLNSLTRLEGGFSVERNLSLKNFKGLDSLRIIKQSIMVNQNRALTDFQGLENLTLLEGLILIQNNPLLTEIKRLGEKATARITNLIITNCGLLSVCENQAICDYLSVSTNLNSIFNNASGCNTNEEVRMACQEVVGLDNPDELEVSIYPNPAIQRIKLSESIEGSLTISNTQGQILVNKKLPKSFIDVSELAAGIYVVHISSQGRWTTQKLFIQ